MEQEITLGDLSGVSGGSHKSAHEKAPHRLLSGLSVQLGSLVRKILFLSLPFNKTFFALVIFLDTKLQCLSEDEWVSRDIHKLLH